MSLYLADSPFSGRRVLLLSGRDCSLGEAILAGLLAHGCHVQVVPCLDIGRRRPISVDAVDLILGYGPHDGSILDALSALRHAPGSSPLVAWWLLENLPDPQTPLWIQRLAFRGRLTLDRAFARFPSWQEDTRRGFLSRGQRFRILGELDHLHRRGRLDRLFVGSVSAARVLDTHGIPAVRVPFGHSRALGRDLGLARDIDVAFLGRSQSPRRQRLLNQTTQALERRGLRVVVEDGRHGYLDGEARTIFLNRCKVLLNLLKSENDSTLHRFFLAAANKTLTVSEPLVSSDPFEPGKHFVRAPVEDLAAIVEFHVENQTARDRMAQAAYDFVNRERPIGRVVGRILSDCWNSA